MTVWRVWTSRIALGGVNHLNLDAAVALNVYGGLSGCYLQMMSENSSSPMAMSRYVAKADHPYNKSSMTDYLFPSHATMISIASVTDFWN
jgi:hypothetical protein